MAVWRFPGAALSLFLFLAAASGAHAEPNVCLVKVAELEQLRLDGQSRGGLWALLERSPETRGHSQRGMALDSRVSAVLFRLDYLCRTLDGIPLNDLATFLIANAQRLGKDQLRLELRVLGKTDVEIGAWLRFIDWSQEHLHRVLDWRGIQDTIAAARPFFERYAALCGGSRSVAGNFTGGVELLLRDISVFINADVNLQRAEMEQEQIPYWDYSENYGGS